MPHVITEKCLGERYGSCIQVCPTEAIHATQYKGQEFSCIDPETCIDCGACVPECPIGAIVPGDDSPQWAKINAELAPQSKNSPKPAVRPSNDPPRNPKNQLAKK
ncbi:MAG: ferredoxin family protein [Elusimicrobia bacterium]|nr:ferredoxin family protein [Elusimicrobiota bacterium]